jgi:hypothetical protein
MKNLFEIELKKETHLKSKKENTKNYKDKKRVLIGTPSLDGKVDVWYADSLSKTITLCENHNIEVFPIFICNESIIHMARNEFLKMAYELGVDSLVFIDGDQSWDHNYFLKVVQSEKNALALPVCLKQDDPIFNFSTFSKKEDVKFDQKTGEFTVDRIGTGFFKLSKKLIHDLWNSNETIIFRDDSFKFVFDFSISNGQYVGEDYTLCAKIKEMGYDIWMNPNSTCNHIGSKKYTYQYVKEFLKEKNKKYD